METPTVENSPQLFALRVRIENLSDDKFYNLNILNDEKNPSIKYEFFDEFGNNPNENFLKPFGENKYRLLRIIQHVHCDYSKYETKQINQQFTFNGSNKTSKTIIEMVIDPYQYQTSVCQISVEHIYKANRPVLGQADTYIKMERLMPDTITNFTLVCEKI